MRHPIRFLTAAAACVALLATLTGVAIAQHALGDGHSGSTWPANTAPRRAQESIGCLIGWPPLGSSSPSGLGGDP